LVSAYSLCKIPFLVQINSKDGLGGLAYFYLWRNVTVLTQQNGRYVPIGKLHLSAKVGIADLTPFSAKATSSNFMLVINRPSAKALAGQTITVKYNDLSLQHTVQDGSGEYQYEINF
jgi:hypothetical protein